MATKGKDFEQAVHAFASAICKTGRVYFDHKVPDVETRTTRQVDVWIETTVGGHFPAKILVSCKDLARPLDISHIGTFRDEVRSTGASFGVIYSRNGFTKNALEKARLAGLSCCRLYVNQPADMPAISIKAYHLIPVISTRLRLITGSLPLLTWRELMAEQVGGSEDRIIDRVSVLANSLQSYAVEQSPTGFLQPCEAAIGFESSLSEPANSTAKYEIVVSLTWKRFIAEERSTIVNGSYCFTNNQFSGVQIGPSIDTQSEHPGNHWTEIGNDYVAGVGLTSISSMVIGTLDLDWVSNSPIKPE